MEKCINQIFRPTRHVNVTGMGNCVICQTDPSNKNCSGFQPIKITINKVEIKEVKTERP